MRLLGIAIVAVMVATGCGGETAPENENVTTTSTTIESVATESTTTTAARVVVTAAPAVDRHPFDEYVWDEFLIEAVTVRDAETQEWAGWEAPADAMTLWYCSGLVPSDSPHWSYTVVGTETPEGMFDAEVWRTVFWDPADEMVCSNNTASSKTDATSEEPTIGVDASALGAEIVPFFYPGYQLDHVVASSTESSTLRLVGVSIANPDFRIIFDVTTSDAASEGCDFTYAPTGETWCHSTAPSGLEALAGRDAMIPASHLAGIEADLSGLGIVVTDFQLNSNVAITLLAISAASVDEWDGASYDEAIGLSLDIAAGRWIRS